MVDRVIPLRTSVQLDDIERRYFFAVWPQAYVHPSWFEMLDLAVGLKLSRRFGRGIGLAEEAVAQALLCQVGVDRSARFPVDQVPPWSMRSHAPMRSHLSTVATLSVLPALKLMVSGAQTRQWEAVLGLGVRQQALKLCQIHPHLVPPTQAMSFLRAGAEASRAPGEWDRFCLSLGLAALAQFGDAVRSRVRLAWPLSYRQVEPLALNESAQSWLATVCLTVAQALPVHPPLCELAA